MADPAPTKRLAVRAIDVICSVSERNFERPRAHSFYIPVRAVKELADEIERQYPGAIAHTRRLMKEVKPKKEESAG